MANNYWAARMAKAQDAMFRKNRRDIDKRMRKYYQSISQQVIEDFEATYEKLLNTLEAGKQPTPADLYKLDKYWKMNKQVEQNLTRLGRKQIATLTKSFKTEFWDVYKALKLGDSPMFHTIDENAVDVLLNQIWCTDGKSWSQRIWENTKLLQQTLNDELLHCVAAGKKPSHLKQLLQERFNVSYGRADALVRTELAHVQTVAAQQRYRDYGIEQMEVWVDEDERTCPICSKLEGKIYSINDKMPVPVHPRCRCCMIPVVKVPVSQSTQIVSQNTV